ncbi:MAG: 2-oxoisovalerate dehydrogenase [Gammaproteobacteria bacterium]|nr:2-oxoisovalerate dehydrogenase [Gammaproteobacteria bacterium]MYD80602.1 2-oxoisovalerate dehydrogenase [Gammaproteobacteria bacterium]
MKEPPTTNEVIFEVTEALEGGYNARALGHSIFTQGDNWNDLKEMVRDAVLCHFEEKDVPSVIRLHLVRDESIAV